MAEDALLESAETDTAEPITDENMSLAEHAAQFGPQATEPDAEAEPAADAQGPTVQHHSAEQRREAESGKFKDGKKRHRAASQQASPADVPRIQKLTAEKNELLEQNRRYQAQLAAAVAPTRPQAQAPTQQSKPQAQAPTAAAKPVSANFDNYDDFIDALTDWKTDQKLAASQAAQAERVQQTQRQLSVKDADDAFAERMQAAAKKYPDFAQVIAAPPWIHPNDGRVHPDAVMLDAYIRERPQGPDVLHYLTTHRDELTAILSMRSANGPDVVGQYEALTLLAQRLGSSSSTQAGTTGSAAGRSPRYTPPTPPNPVRTEASAPIVGPPTDDRPMSLAEHAKWFGPNRKR